MMEPDVCPAFGSGSDGRSMRSTTETFSSCDAAGDDASGLSDERFVSGAIGGITFGPFGISVCDAAIGTAGDGGGGTGSLDVTVGASRRGARVWLATTRRSMNVWAEPW